MMQKYMKPTSKYTLPFCSDRACLISDPGRGPGIQSGVDSLTESEIFSKCPKSYNFYEIFFKVICMFLPAG